MLGVTGKRSRITQELVKLIPEETIHYFRADETKIPVCKRYLLCAGIIRSQRIWQQTEEEIAETLRVNFTLPVKMCELILEKQRDARICVIGSESGFAWSFDDVYAASKVALHRYVETKKLKPYQQLICIAPSIIEDAGMTVRRKDEKILAAKRTKHPKRRLLRSEEVARLIKFVLYEDEGYLTNTVIRMNGGMHT